MKPIEFPEQNIIFGKDQPEYQPLPAHITRDEYGRAITVWEPSEEEISEIVRTKKIYLSQLTFGNPLQPILVSGHKSTFFEVQESELPKQFQPFDPEWKAEMMKWNKDNLIDFLRRVLIESDEKGKPFSLEPEKDNVVNLEPKKKSESEIKAEKDFIYFQNGGHNGPTGHGDDCLSDADPGL